jgi:hypothetical protein
VTKRTAVAGAALVPVCLALVLAAGPLSAAPRLSQATTTSAQALTPDAADRLLGPIALYPDQLLAQVLLCATKPASVRELDAWLAKNRSLKGTELQQAAEAQGFESSFVVLTLFPDVLDMMMADIDWTTKVGQAFTTNRTAVFDSIQRLRAKSKEVGNLKSTPQQEVETRTTESGQQVIVIESANPQVVYVPQYNPQTVYTQPAPTTVVVQDDDDDGAAAAAGVLGFAAGVAIGAAVDNDHYYGPYGYRGGFYMYNDAWDDYYDAREDAREDYYEHREDAREDWQDQRGDLAEERGDRAATTQQERTERQQTRQQNRPETQAQAEQRRAEAQGRADQARSTAGTSAATYESRGRSQSGERATTQRSGTRSDAFSGYSSGKAERSASSRGQRSRSSSRGGGRRR